MRAWSRAVGVLAVLGTAQVVWAQAGMPATMLLPAKRSWGPEQATGAPDTLKAGDQPTAWASRERNGGEEWLKLEYERAVNISEVRVRETDSPGGIRKVTACPDDGEEVVLWEGEDPTRDAPADFLVAVHNDVTAKTLKVYLDTKRRSGWEEIDAVELVGKDGTRQWATKAEASSTRAGQAGGGTAGAYAFEGTYIGAVRTGGYSRGFDPLRQALNQTVKLQLEGGIALSGKLRQVGDAFILVEDEGQQRMLLVNEAKIITIEFTPAPATPLRGGYGR